MKTILRIIIIGSFIAFLNACKKDSNNSQSGNIIGKWHETKLTLNQSVGSGAEKDTTFTSGAFTDADYFQFNSDKTASLSQSGIYTVGGKAIGFSNGFAAIAIAKYKYSIADSTLTLTSTLIPPTNSSGDNSNQLIDFIVQLDATHLVLRHSIYSPGPYNLIETSYFTKVN